MADPTTCLPLTPASIVETHERIKPYVHETPLLTSSSLNTIASSTDPSAFLSSDPPSVHSSPDKDLSAPRFSIFLKNEAQQRIGAFKARGAFSAITHLISSLGIDKLRVRGVITHSSGNHAQALALAASTFDVPAWIVMPKISTPSKISGTQSFPGVNVVFSGSTSSEREEVVKGIMDDQEREKGSGNVPILVPPYDHPDIMLGQGTTGLEMEQQLQRSVSDSDRRFDLVLTPIGGGGLLSGNCIYYGHTHGGDGKTTRVIGCEPSFQGCNDAEIGLAQGKRIETVKSLTIADGLRTPVGILPWNVVSDKSKCEGVYSVTEDEIKSALKLLMERVKLFVEPSAAVPVAVILFNTQFRLWVKQQQDEEEKRTGQRRPWDVGVVLSGGNTTVEALTKLFRPRECIDGEEQLRTSGKKVNGVHSLERETAEIANDGTKKVENVAG